MNPRRIDPIQVGQFLSHPLDNVAQVALQRFILLKSDKGACHAANSMASSSEPSMVST